MNSGKVLAGVLAGLAAGVVIGVLIAPEKGSRTRKQIIYKGEGYADELKGKFDDLVHSLNKKYQSILQKTDSMVANEKSKHEDIKSESAGL